MLSKSWIRGGRKKELIGLESLLAIVGLEVTTEGTGTSTGRWRERVPNFRGCNTKTASAKWCADKRSREKISVGESEGTMENYYYNRRSILIKPGRVYSRRTHIFCLGL